MKKELKKQINDICVDFAFSENSIENRQNLVNKLNALESPYVFYDKTTLEEVDRNFCFFAGIDKTNNHVLHITISPSIIKLS